MKVTPLATSATPPPVAERTFAHILLFRCTRCGAPVTVSCSSTDLNREYVATQSFKQVCVCGWLGAASGLTAIRHWVECWQQ